MISKELITKVLQMYPQYSLDDECTGNIQYKPNSNVVHFEVNNNGMSQINTYELAHKCKEWALTQDFSIKTTYDFTHTCFASVYGLQRGTYYNIQSDTEPEAIFKACQWILDNKETK